MTQENNSNLNNKWIYAIFLVAIALFFFVNYQMVGIRLFIGVVSLYFVPFYIILDSFELAFEEKLIFSFFIGIGIVPLLVFYLTKILVSFRISISVCFVALIAGSLIFRKFYKKN